MRASMFNKPRTTGCNSVSYRVKNKAGSAIKPVKHMSKTATASADNREFIRQGFWFLGMALLIEVSGLLVILLAWLFTV